MGYLFEKNNVRLWLFILILTLIYGVAFIFSEFYGSPVNGVKDVMVLGMQWGVILFATLGLDRKRVV